MTQKQGMIGRIMIRSLGMAAKGCRIWGRMKLFWLAFVCLGTTWMVWATSPVAAQQAGELILNASAGYQGYFKEARWLPVRVTLENNGPMLKGEVVVQFTDVGQESAPYVYPIELPSVARKEITLYIYPSSGYATQLTVSFRNGREVKAIKALSLSRLNVNDDLMGVLAATPSAFNFFSLIDPYNGAASVVELQPSDLPELALGLEAFDVLIFSGVDTGSFNEGQLTALKDWTAWGGRLVITGGPDWQKTAFGLQAAGLLPLAPDRSLVLSGQAAQDVFNEIKLYAGSSVGLTPLTNNLVVAAGALAPQAQVLASVSSNGMLPLVTRWPFSNGEVIYLAFDPSLPPFRSWIGLENLYRTMLSASLPEPSWKNGFSDWSMAQQAVQTLPSLGLPSIFLICGFLLVYTIAIGPANFLLLRALKRRELGWLTIPVLVTSFSVLVFITGNISRGQKPILHRLSIVQGWQGAAHARVDGMLGVYSPYRGMFKVSSVYPTVLHPVPTFSLLPQTDTTIVQSAEFFSIDEVRVDVGSVYPLGYQSSLPSPVFEGDLTLSIDENGTRLNGEITNLSSLELEDAILLTQTNSTPLGKVTPGQKFPINRELDIARTGDPITRPGGLKPAPGYITPASGFMPVNIIEQILGTLNFYQDRQTFRKYALLVAAMTYQPTALIQSGQVYLIGWSRQPFVEIGLENVSSNTEDLSLFIYAFNPSVEFIGERWTLTPGFFQWTSLDPLRSDISPYNLYLYSPTTYELVFTPRQPLDFTKINALTFHLLNPYESSIVTGSEFFLWNYELQDWEPLDGLVWGDNSIQFPERFVAMRLGSDDLGGFTPGTIRLRVESSSSYLEIHTSDFTLEVER